MPRTSCGKYSAKINHSILLEWELHRAHPFMIITNRHFNWIHFPFQPNRLRFWMQLYTWFGTKTPENVPPHSHTHIVQSMQPRKSGENVRFAGLKQAWNNENKMENVLPWSSDAKFTFCNNKKRYKPNVLTSMTMNVGHNRWAHTFSFSVHRHYHYTFSERRRTQEEEKKVAKGIPCMVSLHFISNNACRFCLQYVVKRVLVGCGCVRMSAIPFEIVGRAAIAVQF